MIETNQLREYFDQNNQNCIDKWLHYFDIYDFWFNKYKKQPVVILEIGIFQGGSLQMWRDYFGQNALIFAIDKNPACKQFETENTKIFIGSQEDREFLKHVKSQIPKVDIIVDDGGHTMRQQIVSFEELYDHVKNDGLYLCEDLHTSYWKNYGGGYKNKKSFVEYSKNLIDKINAWKSRDRRLAVDDFTRTTYSLHYYPSLLVIEKKLMKQPVSQRKGRVIIAEENFPAPVYKRGLWSLTKNIFSKVMLKIQKEIS